ncbi:branched-chain amino acid ABC transporter substrate-binding protein [Candidatus Leptofilum sp.]|uniref:branched-chain amino acid ABC transporter substrate-binding protein n=1 Tax=Candidatus Leptofilum sp. TaxID=3241576 RepID=UPI003B5BFA4F
MDVRRRWLFLCLGLLWLVIGCQTDPIQCEDALGCAVVRPGSPIQLVTLLPTSGETAVWGQELTRGINLALSNRGGELLDHNIELLLLDSGCDPDVGLEAVQTLDEESDLVGIIGPACSDVATAVLPTVRRNDWLLISPASTAPSLTANAPNLAFFRTIPSHLHQATVAAHFAYEELGVRETAVFFDSSEFNSLLAQQFAETFTQLGGNVIYRGTLTLGQPDVANLLTEAADSSPELIYLALFEPEGTLIVNQLANNNSLNRSVLLGSDSLRTTQFAGQLGDFSTTIYVTGPSLSGSAYDNFEAAWVNRYETLPTNAAPAYAYDATQLLLTAIEEVAIAGQNGSLIIGREALRQHLTTLELAGLTGNLRCTPTGDCAASTYGVYELDTAVRTDAFWPPPLIWQFDG